MNSPLVSEPLLHAGPIPISAQVVVSWAIIAALGGGAVFASRRLRLRGIGGLQATLELFVTVLDDQIRAIVAGDPRPYRSLIGTLLLFILCANWSSLIPAVDPPTAHLETAGALAAIVFAATIGLGIRARGVLGYVRSFAEPSWIMIPLNMLEQLTRTFALMVRLFGNVMSGVFVIGIILSLAGLLVPIPLMALDLLTGAVQAYIFAVLAAVFIASAVGQGGGTPAAGTPAARDEEET